MSSAQVSGSNRQITAQTPYEEWDFARCILELVTPISKWEGLAALEYELTRELFTLSDCKYAHVIMGIIEASDKLENAISDSYNHRYSQTTLSLLSELKPKAFHAINYKHAHPYILEERHFKSTPCISLDEMHIKLNTLAYMRNICDLVPKASVISIDLEWSTEMHNSFITESKRLLSYVDDILPDHNIAQFNIRTNPGGKGKGGYQGQLEMLGRYRLIRRSRGPQNVWDDWQQWHEENGASVPPSTDQLSRTKLRQRFTREMANLVQRSQFLTGLVDIPMLNEIIMADSRGE